MGVSVITTPKRKISGRPKVKSGCATCRIRKVKCDEGRPFCQRCVKTGRTCDGYQSVFKLSTTQPIKGVHAPAGTIKASVATRNVKASSTEITPEEIELLNRYLSTKTIFDVKLACDGEARQLIEASLTDPAVRHAVSSLRALREDLEAPENATISGYNYGLQQYNMALQGLSSKLMSSGSHGLRSALLCCQIFISIEQVQGNFAAMAQHIIRGLTIMHEYQARPYLTVTNELVPAYHEPLPLLDVFIIKLFAAPCKFAEPPASADVSRTASPACPISPGQESFEPHNLRAIVPDVRTELLRIATSTTEFLDQVSQVESSGKALRLQSEKAALVESLESWLTDLEGVQKNMGPPDPETIHTSFLRMFYLILKIVLWGTLNSSSKSDAEMQSASDRLQDIANIVTERLRGYQFPSGISSGRTSR